MKNKEKLKNFLISFTCFMLFLTSIFLVLNIYEYHEYNKNYNYKISSIINMIEEKYPNVSEKEIIEILNSNDKQNKTLEKYSIDLDNNFLIKNNQKLLYKYIILNVVFYVLTILLMLYYFLIFNKRKDNEINKITKYIQQINKKNYKLDLDDMSEDELSILKNEIYKTTINLKEFAEISVKEKSELKKSLSDISHQLKTPLTSINIILDDLIDDPDMDKETRDDFIKDIKRQINNINFLVQSILKLSKLDTNTIDFNRKQIKIKNILKESIKNVSMLSDLKNIKIRLNCNDNILITCDFKWQIEAISNILKNSIEHTNSIVGIIVEDNKIYSSIKITNDGKQIDEKDLPHIFERFYKGKNSLPDSIGIGLSLSKALIEKDNGKISVKSNTSETTFLIKYYK